MDWDALYIAAKNPRIRPVSHDWFQVSPSLSSPAATEMNSQTLAAFSFFTEPKTMREAFDELAERLDASEDDFAAAFDGIVDAGLLIEVTRDAPDAPDPGGESDPRLMIATLADADRLRAFRAALAKHAPGKIVASLGCGCGVVAAMAAKAGARAVYAVEESGAIALAEQLADANGSADRMSFIHGASTEIELPDPAEVLVVEWPGPDPLRHHIRAILADARERLLAPGAHILPSRVDFVCTAVEASDLPPAETLAAAAGQLGLDAAPLLDAYESGGGMVSRVASGVNGDPLSKPVLLLSLDLAAGEDEAAENEVELEIVRGGRCGGFLVTVEAWLEGPAPLGAILYSSPRSMDVSVGDTLTVVAREAEGLQLSLAG